MEPKVKLELTINEVNLMFAGLGKLPYEAVFNLVETIRSQVGPQLKNEQPMQEGDLRSKVLPN